MYWLKFTCILFWNCYSGLKTRSLCIYIVSDFNWINMDELTGESSDDKRIYYKTASSPAIASNMLLTPGKRLMWQHCARLCSSAQLSADGFCVLSTYALSCIQTTALVLCMSFGEPLLREWFVFLLRVSLCCRDCCIDDKRLRNL